MFTNILNQPRDLPSFWLGVGKCYPSVNINGWAFFFNREKGRLSWISTPHGADGAMIHDFEHLRRGI